MKSKRFHIVPGQAPGTLDESPSQPSNMSLVSFDEHALGQTTLFSLDDLPDTLNSSRTHWLHIQNTPNSQTLQALGERFGIHPLNLEDVSHTHQRPKIESFPHYTFIVLRSATLQPDLSIQHAQISFFLLHDNTTLITIASSNTGVLQPILKRLDASRGRIRSSRADYLAYTLLDTIVDFYFPILERHATLLEDIETDLTSPKPRTQLQDLHPIRRQLLGVRRAFWPLRDMLSTILRDDDLPFQPQTLTYLRDCYDHTVHIVDLIESYRDLASSLTDLYLARTDMRMNEVVQVLTIISTIFIPLSFIVGLYGMNFNSQTSPYNMPELNWAYGYPACLALMLTIAISLLFYFHRKGWLSKPPSLFSQNKTNTSL